MPYCDCGDIYCHSCGPAQGNTHCPSCGGWTSDGGCEDPALCALHCRVMEEGEYVWLAEEEYGMAEPPASGESVLLAEARRRLAEAKAALARYEAALIEGGLTSDPEPGVFVDEPEEVVP